MQGTAEVVRRLKAEGFEVGEGYLRYLLREQIVKTPAKRVGRTLVWEEEEIRRLKAELLRRGRGPADAGRVSA